MGWLEYLYSTYAYANILRWGWVVGWWRPIPPKPASSCHVGCWLDGRGGLGWILSNSGKLNKPIISYRGIPENSFDEKIIFEMEDEIFNTCRTFSMKNKHPKTSSPIWEKRTLFDENKHPKTGFPVWEKTEMNRDRFSHACPKGGLRRKIDR